MASNSEAHTKIIGIADQGFVAIIGERQEQQVMTMDELKRMGFEESLLLNFRETVLADYGQDTSKCRNEHDKPVDKTVIWSVSSCEADDDEATFQLLEIMRREEVTEALKSKSKSGNSVFIRIASELKAKGFNLGDNPASKVKDKWNNLKRACKTWSDNAAKTGAKRTKKPKFYDEMFDLIGKDHSVTPVTLINSSDPINVDTALEKTKSRKRMCEEDDDSSLDLEAPGSSKSDDQHLVPKKQLPKTKDFVKTLEAHASAEAAYRQELLDVQRKSLQVAQERDKKADKLLSLMERLVEVSESKSDTRKEHKRRYLDDF